MAACQRAKRNNASSRIRKDNRCKYTNVLFQARAYERLKGKWVAQSRSDGPDLIDFIIVALQNFILRLSLTYVLLLMIYRAKCPGTKAERENRLFNDIRPKIDLSWVTQDLLDCSRHLNPRLMIDGALHEKYQNQSHWSWVAQHR